MKVSIYIPTFNRPKLLRRAVDSVLSQTYSDIEIIVSNDGDPLPLELVEYLNSQSVRLIETGGRKGACYARNKAIIASSGEYLTGLDDDDYFEERRIESFIDVVKNLGDGIYFSGYKYVENDKSKVRFPSINKVSINQIYKRNIINNQVFAPRHYFIEAGSFDESLPAWQDFDLWIRMIRKFGPALLVKNSSYVMDGSEDVRISKRSENIVNALEIFKNKHPIYLQDSEYLSSLLYCKYVYFEIDLRFKELFFLFKGNDKVEVIKLFIEKALWKYFGYRF